VPRLVFVDQPLYLFLLVKAEEAEVVLTHKMAQ
jgi:hypothetical protein